MFIARLFRIGIALIVMTMILAAVPFVVSAESNASANASANANTQTIALAASANTAANDAAPAQAVAVQSVAVVQPASVNAAASSVANNAPADAPADAALANGGVQAPVYNAETTPMRKGKWIEVILEEQRLIAWEEGRMVMTTLVSTGVRRTPTPPGSFRISRKYEKQRMRGPDYDLPNVPWVMYFYQNYALHGTYWHNNFGQPMSHGCINLPTGKAAWLFQWAPQGTSVVIR